ncbi:MAG: chromate transporter [Treponema sp.]|nr:chromate transporter [Treponema sp.]
MNLVLIYAEFFKIGLFAIGGGYATLPFLFRMTDNDFTFIRQTGWLTREMLGNFLAIGQSLPGAIGVNMAAETGFAYSGIAGSFFAALGLISPAIIIISVIARALTAFKENKIVESVFFGLRPAASGLLAAAAVSVWGLSLYNGSAAKWFEMLRWRECAIFAVLFILIVKLKGHPVIYIALGAVAGIVLGL